MIEAINTLNGPQRDAVLNIDGPSLVIAGAGSGKTRVLTFRIAHLLDSGVKPGNIMSLTFTNKAAREMQERIHAMVGDDAKGLWMGTFHSLFSRILRFECDKIGFTANFSIYDTTDCKSSLKKIIKDLKLDPEVYKVNEVLSKISRAKNSLMTAKAYSASPQLLEYDQMKNLGEIHNIYKIYSQRCKQADAMDFDDLLLYTNLLFKNHADVLAKYQDRFKYVLVDEYQDTNQAQYLIIKKLCEKKPNLCVVGDDAQSIYSFRGAKVENIFNFQTDYPDHKIFKLEQNYRSTQTIVEAANSVIKINKQQLPKTTFSENPQGEKIRLLKTTTDSEEGVYVARIIADKLRREGLTYRDFAILYRTNSQSRIFEEALHKLNIPCKIYGGTAFFQRKEIKDIICYFRLCINQRDEEALYRIINYPARGIGETTTDRMQQVAEHIEVNTWELLLNLDKLGDAFNPATIAKLDKFKDLIARLSQDVFTIDAYTFADRIVTEAGILADLRKGKTQEELNLLQNVEELLNGIKEFSETEKENSIVHYMEKIALLSDSEDDKHSTPNRVMLMTVHSAKGLEFKHIFIVGLEETLFPSGLSSLNEKDIEEERRLFYVAITRAEISATLTFATSRRKWGKLNMCTPSRFIGEIDEKFIVYPDSMKLDMPIERYDQFVSPDDMPVTGNKAISTWGTRLPARPAQPKPESTFKSDDPTKLRAGMTILHERFGEGEIIQIEGVFPDSKASIVFDKSGQKQLLLKFAKLKILK